jgi:hypothetical protein
MRKRDRKAPTIVETGAIPRLALTHGQTIWLMTELGLHYGVSTSTFNYYIKSLRKLGIPFDRGKGQEHGHRHVTYDFEELMELTLALLLRVYGTLPDSVVIGLRSFRDQLRPIYRQACSDLVKGTHPAARITVRQGPRMAVKGLFLDLNIRYSAGQMIEFGPPKVVSPFEAVATYARAEIPARSYLPLNLTGVAEMIIHRTRVLPPTRRNRSPARAKPR